MSKFYKKKSTITLFAALWLVISVIGLGWVVRYSNTPGNFGEPPNLWPSNSAFQLSSEKYTLVLFLHPHCPCSAATLRELAILLTQVQSKVDVRVFFTRAGSAPKDWTHTPLRTSAESMGVRVVDDPDGLEARKFGAQTSGHCLLFGKKGELLFSGGITPFRGHSGDNIGRRAIVSLILTGQSLQKRSRVFGCALRDEHKKL